MQKEGAAAGEYVGGYTSMLRREPLGVVGLITPWNYPLMMAIWKACRVAATLSHRPLDWTRHCSGQCCRAQAGTQHPGNNSFVCAPGA